MTDEMRRAMHARNRVKNAMLDPLTELLEAHAMLVASLQLSASAREEAAFRAGFETGAHAAASDSPMDPDTAWEKYHDRD